MTAQPAFAPVKLLPARDRLARHRHPTAYATIVLEGGYAEFGETGRIEAGPGDILVHAPFCAHADRGGARVSRLVNLALPGRPRTGIARSGDLDLIVRLARGDPLEAAAEIARLAVVPANREADWPDALARRLSEQDVDLAAFAREAGLRPETVSRGFGSRFGIAPQSFAAEARARRAWRAAVDTPASLSAIASETGFCDQAHMTRAVTALTGAPPGAWRRAAALPA
ncbi:AraC family transcriptional regulator [Marinicauda algicola]|uniref:AraC family transcriptional regulator n=1 Tax=Marinicauda algicola TaxID=2029849 RepID=A0A4S2H0R8_9PROT|nr:helix-turn-helix domain-containing protein [Marinicauda algicola]TGY89120.1 AraC family transcriptional regulator [Marinicauda algicola]